MMFVVLLKFQPCSVHKEQINTYMAEHNQWLEQGFKDGIFLLAGSLTPNQGGAIIAHNISSDMLEQRVQQDPFVVHQQVHAEILEIDAKRASEHLAFLLN